jgi:hypothetical protein
VNPGLQFALAIALPTACGYALVLAYRAARGVGRWRDAHRRELPAVPIDRLAADLRRLHAQLDQTETATGLPAKRLRTRAVRAAYVDALGTACRRLDVTPPAPAGRVPLTEIYRVEAALRARGLDVRGAG